MSGLKKQFGFWTAVSMVIGMVIGSGIFFQAQGTLAVTQSPVLSVLAWFLGGVITIAAGMTVSELAAAIPKTGGIVEYLRVAFGDLMSGTCGWMLSVIFFPSVIGVFSIIFAQTFVPFFGLPETIIGLPSINVISVLVVVVIMTINMINAKFGSRIQVVTTIGKLLPIALIIIMGVFFGNSNPSAVGFGNLTLSIPENTSFAVVGVTLGAAIGKAFFAYGGWFDVGAIAGEMKNPSRDLPKAIIFGLLTITVVYTLVNIAYLTTFSMENVLASSTIAADTLGVYFGSAGTVIANIGVLVSVFGALNGMLMAGSRVVYQLGTEYRLPFSRSLQKLSKESKTPIGGLIWVSVFTILCASTGQFGALADIGVFGSWIFYIFAFVAVIVLRKTHPHLVRPYKVPLYPVLPIIAIIGGVYFLVSTIITSPSISFFAIFMVLIGIPVYFALRVFYKDELLAVDVD
ncbi:MAG: amino acid permease [Culicoidibacterales bacterium]